MTGFGSKSGRGQGVQFTAEIKSVNHRYLDIKIKMPPAYLSLEIEVMEAVRRLFDRGRIDIFIREDSLGPVLPFEKKDAQQLVSILRKLKKELGLQGDLTLDNMLAFKDLIFKKNTFPSSSRKKLLMNIMNGALAELEKMRHREGLSLQHWLKEQGRGLKARVSHIELESRRTAKLYKERFRKRLSELVGEGQVERLKLRTDIALYADRIDVTEEVTRLKSHLEQYFQLLGASEASGRKLDFLTQEMAREINTIGAKAQNTKISEAVVIFKGDLEKIKEQIQNIE